MKNRILALTYKTPYDNYHYNCSSVLVTNENLFQIGIITVYALVEYLVISHPKYCIIDNSAAE